MCTQRHASDQATTGTAAYVLLHSHRQAGCLYRKPDPLTTPPRCPAAPMLEKEGEEPPPFVVLVQGPPGVSGEGLWHRVVGVGARTQRHRWPAEPASEQGVAQTQGV